MDCKFDVCKNDILFSVIIPVYNTEQYVDECIQSVLKQSYPNFEIILVNDGSTDNSGSICDKYAENNARISVFHKLNGGQLHTRQYGIEKAKGKYCLFLDSDDYLDINALMILKEYIYRVDYDCIVFGLRRVKEGKVTALISEVEEKVFTDKREIYRKCLFSNEYNSMCRKVIKTDLLKNRSWDAFYHIRRGEDLLQSIFILRDCRNVLFVKDVLYNYRTLVTSVSNNIKIDNIEAENPVRPYIIDFLEREKIFSEQDFEDYRGYCATLLLEKVCNIVTVEAETARKIQILKSIRHGDYFEKFIANGNFDKKILGNKKVFYFLFLREKYRILIPVVKMLRWMRKFAPF